ncbi:MAG: hypothetical protein GXP44_02175 [bacterium]|nr:hypothetical protein [bacterium]
MIIPWTVKRQLTFLFIAALIVGAAVFSLWIVSNNPTCFDGKQNQGEESVDCGGPCEACLGEIKNLVVSWAKPFKLKDGVYDAAALVENPNLFLALPSLKYKFKLYDEDGVLVAVRGGETFFNPGEKFVIFETGIETGKRIPKRAFIELEQNPRWKRIEKETARLVVSGKSFTNDPFPRLTARISNKSIFSADGVYAVAVLYDGEKNATAASSAAIGLVDGGSSRQISFTWPKPFAENPASSEILLRTNWTEQPN